MTDSKQHKAPRVQLKPNVQKILAAITHIIGKAESINLTVTQYDILKTLFLADKSHLNEYGRPVTFDNYYAMRDGPVPSFSYDLLKENKSAVRKANLDHFPWKRNLGPNGRYYYSEANVETFKGTLSDSDTKALFDAFRSIKSLTYGQIKRLTHADPAFIEAWDDEDHQKKAYEISYGMLFDSPDYEQAEAVEFLSKNM